MAKRGSSSEKQPEASKANRIRNHLSPRLLPFIVVAGLVGAFLFLTVALPKLVEAYPVVWLVISTTLISALILAWYVYLARQIWWDMDRLDKEPADIPDHRRGIEVRRSLLVTTYKVWIRNAYSGEYVQLIVTGGISALMIGLLVDAWKKAGSWQDFLTIDHLPLFVWCGTAVAGWILYAICIKLMNKRFRKRIAELDAQIEEASGAM